MSNISTYFDILLECVDGIDTSPEYVVILKYSRQITQSASKHSSAFYPVYRAILTQSPGCIPDPWI